VKKSAPAHMVSKILDHLRCELFFPIVEFMHGFVQRLPRRRFLKQHGRRHLLRSFSPSHIFYLSPLLQLL